MARRRRRSTETSQDAATNLTSMLDVIFNILAYFIITFQPPIPDKNFDLSLPPPKIQETSGTSQLPSVEPDVFDQFNITLRAGADGGLAGIRMEPCFLSGSTLPQPANPGELTRNMLKIMDEFRNDEDRGFNGANIFMPNNLKYGELIRIVDACYAAGLRKLNFSPTAGGGAQPNM